MDDSTRHFIDEDQSTLQEVQTEDTPTHDVHDVIEYDEHDLSDVSPYVDSESDNECRRPTPNGRKYWIPDVPVEEKPTEGDVFDNFDEAYNMYLEYSQKARFSIRKSTTKRKNGNITHKYILCSKAGKPRKTIVKDTLVQDNQKEVDQNEGAKKSRKNRYSSFTVTDCKAAVRFKAIHGTKCYKLYDFVENHNHPLVDENNLDNLKARRKLDFSDKVFIHRASLSNIGPTKAHRLRVAFMGGYHKVRGKAIDWKNFRRSLNKYIGPRDAQMLVDKLNDRKKHVPNFSFEYKTVNDELSRMFWADETMKCNYIAFGDVVSFDATYKYIISLYVVSIHVLGHYLVMKHFFLHQVINCFLNKRHGKRTLMVSQIKMRIAKCGFPWITSQICGDVENDSEFKKRFHKLIWNLSEMFEIKDRWILGYFNDLPMCCLMKTTSRSESSNAFFQIHSHQGNMLVQFMLYFEAAMEKQRYTQRIADNRTFESTPVMFTALPIEQFACQVYSRSIFREVQKEISKGLYYCSQISANSEDGSKICVIRQTNKRNETVLNVK
ncbi:FAR1-related sequence 5-like protein, partial [Tanacetum coccineum]